MIKKLLITLGILAMTVTGASAACIVNAAWTPSPDAVSEYVLLDGIQQTCASGQCEFIVPELTGQKVIIRSFNSQGGYVDYEAATLDKESLPTPAANISITIMCTE